MLKLEDVLDDLGIDYADEQVTKNVTRIMATADRYLRGSLGKDYPIDDPRVIELAHMVINDLYDNKGMSEKTAGNYRRLWDDMAWQIRLEMRVENEV